MMVQGYVRDRASVFIHRPATLFGRQEYVPPLWRLQQTGYGPS